MKIAALFCLKCGSEIVDINNWKMGTTTAEVICTRCGNKGLIQGLTVGRVVLNGRQLAEASEDKAIPWWLRESV
ncbi:hypothetical protein JCM14036_02920 [Desulfotomaculum defluvii]